MEKQKAGYCVIIKISLYTYCTLSYYFYITIFVNKKAKIAKNLLHRKVFATCISATSILIAISSALQFLEIKKRKLVY